MPLSLCQHVVRSHLLEVVYSLEWVCLFLLYPAYLACLWLMLIPSQVFSNVVLSLWACTGPLLWGSCVILECCFLGPTISPCVPTFSSLRVVSSLKPDYQLNPVLVTCSTSSNCTSSTLWFPSPYMRTSESKTCAKRRVWAAGWGIRIAALC